MAALRAPAALPRHYPCGVLVWSPSWLAYRCNRSLSPGQVSYWNKYSDTLVRYSRYICVNRRDKYSLYSTVYQLRVCRFISR